VRDLAVDVVLLVLEVLSDYVLVHFFSFVAVEDAPVTLELLGDRFGVEVSATFDYARNSILGIIDVLNRSHHFCVRVRRLLYRRWVQSHRLWNRLQVVRRCLGLHLSENLANSLQTLQLELKHR
jgi:hypothetical protein